MNEVTWIVAADGPPTDVYEERRRGGPMQRLAAARTAILKRARAAMEEIEATRHPARRLRQSDLR